MKNKTNDKSVIKTLFNLFGKKTIVIASLVLMVVIAAAIIITANYQKEEEIDTSYIIAKLEKSSELITAKLKFTGMSEFKDAGIPFISKSDFIMVYDANAQAGIDVKEIDIDKNEATKEITISLPKAKVLSVSVDHNSIKYFDESFALFNLNEKEDANKANALAEEEAKKELAEMGILSMADEQAVTLVTGLMSDLDVKDYTVHVKQAENN